MAKESTRSQVNHITTTITAKRLALPGSPIARVKNILAVRTTARLPTLESSSQDSIRTEANHRPEHTPISCSVASNHTEDASEPCTALSFTLEENRRTISPKSPLKSKVRASPNSPVLRQTPAAQSHAESPRGRREQKELQSPFKDKSVYVQEDETLREIASKKTPDIAANAAGSCRTAPASKIVGQETASGLELNDSFNDIIARKHSHMFKPIIPETEAFSGHGSDSSFTTILFGSSFREMASLREEEILIMRTSGNLMADAANAAGGSNLEQNDSFSEIVARKQNQMFQPTIPGAKDARGEIIGQGSDSSFTTNLFGSSFREMQLSNVDESLLLASPIKMADTTKSTGSSIDAATSVEGEAVSALELNNSFSEIISRRQHLFRPIIQEAEACSGKESSTNLQKADEKVQILPAKKMPKRRNTAGCPARCGDKNDVASRRNHSHDLLSPPCGRKTANVSSRPGQKTVRDILGEALSISTGTVISPLSCGSTDQDNGIGKLSATGIPPLPQIDEPVTPNKTKGGTDGDAFSDIVLTVSPSLSRDARLLKKEKREEKVLVPSLPLVPPLGIAHQRDPDDNILRSILELSGGKKKLPSTKDLEFRQLRQRLQNVTNTAAFTKLSEKDKQSIYKMLGSQPSARQGRRSLSPVKTSAETSGMKFMQGRDSFNEAFGPLARLSPTSPASVAKMLEASPGRKEKNLISPERIKQLLTDLLLLKLTNEDPSKNVRHRSCSPSKKNVGVHSLRDSDLDDWKKRKLDLVIPRHDHLVSPKKKDKLPALPQRLCRMSSAQPFYRSEHTRSTSSLQEGIGFLHHDYDIPASPPPQPTQPVKIRHSQALALSSRSGILSDIKTHRPATSIENSHERQRPADLPKRARSVSPRKEHATPTVATGASFQKGKEIVKGADGAPRRPLRRRSNEKDPPPGAGRPRLSEFTPPPSPPFSPMYFSE